MTCSYCGSRNADGEHRCRRCGRRADDTLSGEPLHRTTGALAAAPRLARCAIDPVNTPEISREQSAVSGAVQGSLFQTRVASKVIPIESYTGASAKAAPAPVQEVASHREPKDKPHGRRAPSRTPENQGSLDFLPAMPATPRKLGTTVEAVIYCEAPVATPLHRAVAAALDWSMVLIGYGLFLLAFSLAGGQFVLTKSNLAIFAGALPFVAFAYGLLWTVAGTETAGMRWAGLRLTTFDGFEPESRQRLVRFSSACLSFCTLLGLLWSFADEESLTWHDHISRTFPTPRGADSQIFQRR